MYQCWCFIVEFNLGVCSGTASLASICSPLSRLRRHATNDFQLLAGSRLHPTTLHHVEINGAWVDRTCRLRDCTISLHISNSSLHREQVCKSATTSLHVIHIEPSHNDQQPVNNILLRRGCLCSDLLLRIPHRTASSTILSQTPPAGG
jgi:hypothetical protein